MKARGEPVPNPVQQLEHLFLYHIWACIPFVIAWLIWTEPLGELPADDPRSVSLKIVYGLALPYLLLRSVIAFRYRGGFRWEQIWPFLDVFLISAGLSAYAVKPESWPVLLYLLPVIESSATLDLRWSLAVGALAVAGYVTATGSVPAAGLGTAAGQFRPFFLMLMASLFCQLGREIARARRELAVAEYRNALAAEMHDGIQHYLVAIAMRLELARSLVDRDPARAARLAVDQQHLARQAADELRVLVRRLRSPRLEQEGLPEAVRQYADLFGQRSVQDIEVTVTGLPHRLAPSAEQAVLRIVQEALTNVIKHAQATRVEVWLDFRADELIGRVSDDGRGFDPSAPPADELAGIGADTMRRRAEAIGASFELVSAPGSGTTVTVRVPLPLASH